MVEKMTAVWLIILTILVCAAVPGILIWLSTTPTKATAPAKMVLGLNEIGKLTALAAIP
ncbi:MAG: hypothetical protein M3258_05010 [Thermoproteota archaeon]|nr:hypothetical protein [Thermoproteota archaeon]